MPYRNMTPEIKYKHLESERNSAIDSVKSAASDLEYLNKESLKGFDNYYDKILFYSAGAFSFTLALVNIVAQQDKVGALTKSSFIIPNVFWLYASWVCYLFVCALIIWNKKLHAVYLGFVGMGRYAEKVKDLRKTEVALLSFPTVQLFSATGSTDAIEKLTENAQMIKSKEKENKEKADFYYKLKMRIATISECLALIATALLMLFSILVTQAFIWN